LLACWVQAFTHSSLTDDCDTLKLGTSQRLEFLGDAVLQYVVTACLYAHYPDQNEGQLTVGLLLRHR
jgi:ribonuclease-3